VHLPDKIAILKMLYGVHRSLQPGGKFLLQILNYDYILGEKVSELPLIETENVKFYRNYKFHEDHEHVKFQTRLQLKSTGEVISNETTLLALISNDLLDLLKKAGFKNIQLYASFKEENFGGKHLPLVVSAKK
jgi:hypothetical protein